MNIWIVLIVLLGVFGFGYYGNMQVLEAEGVCGLGFWKFCWTWSTESINVVQGLWFALR